MKNKSNQEMVCGINILTQIIELRPESVSCLFVGGTKKLRFSSLIEKATKNGILLSNADSAFK